MIRVKITKETKLLPYALLSAKEPIVWLRKATKDETDTKGLTITEGEDFYAVDADTIDNVDWKVADANYKEASIISDYYKQQQLDHKKKLDIFRQSRLE